MFWIDLYKLRSDTGHLLLCHVLDRVERGTGQGYAWSHHHAKLLHHQQQVRLTRENVCCKMKPLHIVLHNIQTPLNKLFKKTIKLKYFLKVPVKTASRFQLDRHESLGRDLHVLHLRLLFRVHPCQLPGAVGAGPWAAEEQAGERHPRFSAGCHSHIGYEGDRYNGHEIILI